MHQVEILGEQVSGWTRIWIEVKARTDTCA